MLEATLNNLIGATRALRELLDEQESSISEIEKFIKLVLDQQKEENRCMKCGELLLGTDKGYCGQCVAEQNSEVQHND
jgi:hypothetical protein